MSTYLDGTVENSLSQLIQDCLVNAHNHYGGTDLQTTTDGAGHYEFEVNANDTYDLTVWHSGYTVEHQNDILATADTYTYVDFIPPDHNLRASVIGTVQDDEGIAVPDVNVYAVGSTYIFGGRTDSSGHYILPLHRPDTYTIKAAKNNFSVRSNVSITQSGNHPTASTTIDFTGSYYLSRTLGTTRLGYAVYGRAVVVPDLLNGSYDLIQANGPATTTVFMKTRKWGSGDILRTYTNGGDSADEGDGSGGSNYDGDCGDCGE